MYSISFWSSGQDPGTSLKRENHRSVPNISRIWLQLSEPSNTILSVTSQMYEIVSKHVFYDVTQIINPLARYSKVLQRR